MRVFITGGTGFLGYNTILHLLNLGYTVYALVRKEHSILSDINNKSLFLVKGTLEDLEITDFPTIDACVHFAWGGVNREGVNNLEIQHQNVNNSIHLIDFLNKHHCRMLIDAGSRQEYAPTTDIITEESPCNPVSEYGKWKLEAYQQTLLKVKDNMKYVHLRIFSTYGYGDHPWSLINTCIDKSIAGESISLGQCRHFWSFLYIQDFAEAVSSVLEKMDFFEGCDVYNIASGYIQPLKYFINTIKSIVESDSELQFGTFKENRESTYPLIPDVSKFSTTFGWYEKVSFPEGILMIINNKKL